MVDKLIDGDYALVPNKKVLIQCDYTDELLQDAFMLLTARRGKFYPNKDFGSKISETTAEPRAEYVAAYAAQALDSLDGVYVKRVLVDGNTAQISLILNEKERQVTISIEDNI